MVNPLVGTWQLRSFVMRSRDGPATHPYGEHVHGYLLYTADGSMSVTMTSLQRPLWGTGNASGVGEALESADLGPLPVLRRPIRRRGRHRHPPY